MPAAAKPVFNRKPLPVEWWVAQKPEDFNILSVGIPFVMCSWKLSACNVVRIYS